MTMTEKKQSRQYIWQQKQIREGKCSACNNDLAEKSGWYCDDHLEKARLRARKRMAKSRTKKGKKK